MTYLDSSLLVKRYYEEVDSSAIRHLFVSGVAIATCQYSYVEVLSALNRKLREGVLTPDLYLGAASALEHDWQSIEIVVLSDAVIRECRLVLQQHPLRAGDAVQLASARVLSRIHPVVFGTADARLRDAALSDGIAVMPLPAA